MNCSAPASTSIRPPTVTFFLKRESFKRCATSIGSLAAKLEGHRRSWKDDLLNRRSFFSAERISLSVPFLILALEAFPIAEIYDCRHTFGTRLGETGADAYTICKLMGHSNILVSQRYVHPTPERLETAFANLDTYNQQRRARAQKNGARKKPKARVQTA